MNQSIDYSQVVKDLILPIVEDKQHLEVKRMPSLNEHEILIYVYADQKDVSRLIGKHGMMATSIRNMISMATSNYHEHVTIRYEAY